MCCLIPDGIKGPVMYPEFYQMPPHKRVAQMPVVPGLPRAQLPPGVTLTPAQALHAQKMQRKLAKYVDPEVMRNGGRWYRGGGAYPGGAYPRGGAYPGRGGHGGRGHPAHPMNPYGGGHPGRGRSHSRAPTRGSHHGNVGYHGGLRGPQGRGIPGSAHPSRAGSRHPTTAHPSRAGSRHPTVIDDGIDGRDPNRGRPTQVPRRGRSASVNPGMRPPTRGGSTRVPRRSASANPGVNGRAPVRQPTVRSPRLAPPGVRRGPDAHGFNAIGDQINDMTYLNR